MHFSNLTKPPFAVLPLYASCALSAATHHVDRLQSSDIDSLWQYVNPLIGTVGATPGSAVASGNAFPGSALPWAFAKPGIDTSFLGIPNGTQTDVNGGYSPLGNVTAVSLTHVHGTGGTPSYGLISQMPILGSLEDVNLADNTTYWQNRTFEAESASPGYFSTTLVNGVKIEITSSNRSAYLRYTLPTNEASGNGSSGLTDAHVLIDLTHVLPGASGVEQYYTQKYLHGDLHVHSSGANPSYFGSATYTGNWVQAESQTLYFCGNFSVPSTSSLQPISDYVAQDAGDRVTGAGTFNWDYNQVQAPDFDSRPLPRSYTDVRSYAGSGQGLGALFSWAPSGNNASAPGVLEAKIGISYISPSQACAYVEQELPSNTSFEGVVQQARQAWEDNILSTIQVVDDGSPTSQNDTLKRMLYTALYHTGLMPTDKTGENPYWETNDTTPYYDDHYTLWDTYRTLLPLYHLLYTHTFSRVVSGLISIFQHEGYLPAGRAANWNGRVQGGTHADMVLADAYVKSVKAPSGQSGLGELSASIDWQAAYEAMAKDANVLPERNVDPVAPDGATKEGRGALDEYLPYHFITRNHTRSLSRGVEYSQNDYAIWSVATGLNKSTEEVASYLERSSWWQNQWNPYANTSLAGVGNFTGFVGARNADGSWNFTDYDPLTCGGCGWGDDIYEAKVWETSVSAAPHDMAKLIELMGGDDGFVRRLDASFLPGFGSSVGQDNSAGTALFNPSNEPSFATPFLYNYVPGYQWKTVNESRSIVDVFYSDQVNGYPGNIDAGALPSWLIFNLIGIYPVASQPIYLIGAPRFSSLKISLFRGTPAQTTLNILANNLSDTSYYPQQVTFNGRVLNSSWITHAELGQGGNLTFDMGISPAKWDVGERPPSLTLWP